MKNLKFIFLSILLVCLFAVRNNAQDKKVSGEKNKTTECTTEKSSGCCSGEEETAAVIKPWNEVCPVLGNKISTKVKTVEYKGKTYGFCCPGCDDKFQKDPEKYLGNLSEDGKKYIKSKS